MRQWKRNHEAMIAEVGSKGYAQSLELIQTRRQEPALATRSHEPVRAARSLDRVACHEAVPR